MHGLIDRRVEFRDARRGLVEALQHGDGIGMRGAADEQQRREGAGADAHRSHGFAFL